VVVKDNSECVVCLHNCVFGVYNIQYVMSEVYVLLLDLYMFFL